VGGVVIAVIIILARLVFGSPMMQSVRESFANATAPSLANSTTSCPKGTKFYVGPDGVSYCCSGTINYNADTVAASCPSSSATFCTLGASTPTVPNCLTIRGVLMQTEGATFCPSTMPTYVEGDERRCCTAGNADLTACASAVSQSCVVTDDKDPFKNPASCQFLKAREEDGTCPATYNPFTSTRDDITIYGCTNTATNCYLQSTLQRLQFLGHDVTGLVPCASS